MFLAVFRNRKRSDMDAAVYGGDASRRLLAGDGPRIHAFERTDP